MDQRDQTLEAEIVEIDGLPVDARSAERAGGWNDWQGHRQRVMTLNPKLMPLWIILGFILLVLVVAVGMVLAVLFGFFKVLKCLVNAVAGPLVSAPNTTIR